MINVLSYPCGNQKVCMSAIEPDDCVWDRAGIILRARGCRTHGRERNTVRDNESLNRDAQNGQGSLKVQLSENTQIQLKWKPRKKDLWSLWAGKSLVKFSDWEPSSRLVNAALGPSWLWLSRSGQGLNLHFWQVCQWYWGCLSRYHTSWEPLAQDTGGSWSHSLRIPV